MTDHELDAMLRDLAVPDEARRLVAFERLFADESLDRLLARVTVPAGLDERVRAAARQPARGCGAIDLSRMTAAPPKPAVTARRPWSARGLAGAIREAATVAVALGLVMVVFLAGSGLSRRLEGGGRQGRPRVAPSLTRTPVPQREPAGGEAAVAVDPSARAVPADPAPAAPSPEFEAAPQMAAAAAEPPAMPARAPLVRGAAVDLAPLTSAGHRGMLTVPLPRDARRSVPRSPAFDLVFEMTHGEAPFVDPAADGILAVDRPPLTLSTDSFDRLLAGEDRGRSAGAPVRTEEILAALTAPVGSAAGVGVTLRAVEALRAVGGRRALLLEATVSAGRMPDADAGPHEPVRATLVLDQTEGGDPPAWRRVCRGLAAVAETMAADDRITVVLCGPRPRIAVRDADARRLAAVAADLESLPPAASSDPDAALDLAQTVAEGPLVMVAHVATLDRGRGLVRKKLASWQESLAAHGGDLRSAAAATACRFVVLDSAAPTGIPRPEPTFGRTGPDAIAIRRAMLAEVFCRETLVGRQCSLEVRFDPRLVAAYRIVGHRQTAVESLAKSAAAAIDLHAGESARVVYEVVPRTPVTTGLATATASWLPPEGGDRRRATATAGGPASDAARSPRDRELLLAVGLGEVLGDSPHVTRRGAVVADLAAIVADWQADGDLTAVGAGLVRCFERHLAGRTAAR